MNWYNNRNKNIGKVELGDQRLHFLAIHKHQQKVGEFKTARHYILPDSKDYQGIT